MVIALRVVAGSALIGPRVFQSEPRDAEHAHAVGPVRRVNSNPPFAGPAPQLLKGVRPVDFSVPPLDLRDGVTDHVTVQLKGVPCQLDLRHWRLHKPGWRGEIASGRERKRSRKRVRALKRLEQGQGMDKESKQFH